MAAGSSSRSWVRARYAAVIALVSLVALEALLIAVRRIPALSAATPLRTLARELYMLDRHIIQVEPEAARWDPRLGYTLRPGEFVFANTEFRTRYRVNSLGLRDDEASLEAPEIVVIGDSFAMGWGVDQHDSFPEVLEEISGRRVLNTAVSSWGTARSLRLLDRLNLDHARHLIIQFCNNDYFENLAFSREGPDFAVQSEAEYRRAVANYQRNRRYWPGRYAAVLVGSRLGLCCAPRPHPDPEDPANQRLQAELFLQVLQASAGKLEGLQIIVFELNSHNRYGKLFIPALREVIAGEEYPDFIRTMTAVDLAAELGPELFYRFDDHITADGHRVLAERLWQIIRELEAVGTTTRQPIHGGSPVTTPSASDPASGRDTTATARADDGSSPR